MGHRSIVDRPRNLADDIHLASDAGHEIPTQPRPGHQHVYCVFRHGDRRRLSRAVRARQNGHSRQSRGSRIMTLILIFASMLVLVFFGIPILLSIASVSLIGAMVLPGLVPA